MSNWKKKQLDNLLKLCICKKKIVKGIVCVKCNSKFHISCTMTIENTKNWKCKYCYVRGTSDRIGGGHCESGDRKKEQGVQNSNSPIKI